MAIQGIVKGYASPSDLGLNLILVGRGASYVLIADGRVAKSIDEDLDSALRAFDERSRVHCHDDWQAVSQITTDGVTGRSVVAGLVSSHLFSHQAGSSDDGDGAGEAFMQQRDRG